MYFKFRSLQLKWKARISILFRSENTKQYLLLVGFFIYTVAEVDKTYFTHWYKYDFSTWLSWLWSFKCYVRLDMVTLFRVAFVYQSSLSVEYLFQSESHFLFKEQGKLKTSKTWSQFRISLTWNNLENKLFLIDQDDMLLRRKSLLA